MWQYIEPADLKFLGTKNFQNPAFLKYAFHHLPTNPSTAQNSLSPHLSHSTTVNPQKIWILSLSNPFHSSHFNSSLSSPIKIGLISLAKQKSDSLIRFLGGIRIPSTQPISKTLTLIQAIVVRQGELCSPCATPRRLSMVNSSENARKQSSFLGIAWESESLFLHSDYCYVSCIGVGTSIFLLYFFL